MRRLGDILHEYGPGVIVALSFALLALLVASGVKTKKARDNSA